MRMPVASAVIHDQPTSNHGNAMVTRENVMGVRGNSFLSMAITEQP